MPYEHGEGLLSIAKTNEETIEKRLGEQRSGLEIVLRKYPTRPLLLKLR
jgi:hypothetical protein